MLKLPAAEQGDWGLRAQYSLGRVLMNDHGTPMNESDEAAPAANHPPKAELEQALAAFQQVIERVKSGAADPDQLALSSLGQQARIHLWLGDVAPPPTCTPSRRRRAIRAAGSRCSTSPVSWSIPTIWKR